MAAHRTSLLLPAVLAVISCVPAIGQVVGEGMTVAPNEGTLASRTPATTESSPADRALEGSRLPEPFDEPESDSVAVPELTPGDLAQSAAAGRNIPRADRDAFRARWGLDAERQNMRTRLRAAARNRPRTAGKDRQDDSDNAWLRWRFHRYDSLDRMLHWPDSAVPDRHGLRTLEPRQGDWFRPGGHAFRDWRMWNPVPEKPEYNGPWPWEQDSDGTPPGDTSVRGGIRNL